MQERLVFVFAVTTGLTLAPQTSITGRLTDPSSASKRTSAPSQRPEIMPTGAGAPCAFTNYHKTKDINILK
jgi:hypothetical protein